MSGLYRVRFVNSGIDLYYGNKNNVINDIMRLKLLYHYDDAIVITESILIQLICCKDKFVIVSDDQSSTIEITKIYLQD